jgi:hypothetical protein
MSSEWEMLCKETVVTKFLGAIPAFVWREGRKPQEK